LDITGSDLTDVATLINSADLDITATLQDSNKTLKLVSDYGYDIELGKVQIQNIDKSQKTPTSFFTLQPVDGSDAAIGNAQQVFDFDQTIASRLDELVVIQNHLANQRAKVGARMNSVERQQDIMNERKVLVEKDVSELADADLSELVTELQSMMTSQEASQKAFVRISQLNLFDMIS
jgi:flagellar hook-associated protein 3 FlgL